MITTTKRCSELNFEDEENMLNSIRIIRAEYLKKAIKASLCIALILVSAISYLIFAYLPNLHNETMLFHTYEKVIDFNLTIGWIILSTSIFLVVYFLRLMLIKFTPSLVNYLKQEAQHIGFEFSKRVESIFLFCILNVISILILLYLDTGTIIFDDSQVGQLLKFLFMMYLIINLVLPIIWAFSSDGFVIRINKNFMILCDLRYNLIRKKRRSPYFFGILLTSNKLCSKFNRYGKTMHSYISQYRWLRRKKSKYLSAYLHFQEFSIPVNFQKQFLNIAMALNEWENNYSNNLDMLNYYFSRYFPYHKYKVTKYSGNYKEDQIICFKFLRL